MNIAYCLTGYPGSMERITESVKPNDPELMKVSHDRFNKYILENNRVDVYIHTWDNPLCSQYLDLYQPKLHIVEQQPKTLQTGMFFERGFVTEEKQQGIYARHYACNRLIRKILYSNVYYDLFVMTRPDIYWMKPIDFSSLDPNKFHISNWIKFLDVDYKTVPHTELYRLFLGENFFKKYLVAHVGYPRNYAVNDIVFAVGNPFIKSFADIFFMLPKYIQEIKEREINNLKITNHVIIGMYLALSNMMKDPHINFAFAFLHDFSLTRHYLQAKRLIGNQQTIVKRNLK